VAFQTSNPIHRAQEEMIKRAMETIDGTLLLHPVVGLTKPGDIDYYTRVRSYKLLTERYNLKHPVLLALLPLAICMAGLREVLWHAIIQRNYGANHLIIGHDHAAPMKNSEEHSLYEARDLMLKREEETRVKPILFSEFVDLPGENRYEEINKQSDPTIQKQGFCIWFTGLSGAGKSTIANILVIKLLEHGRRVTLLDGDNVRTHLSKGLGFSKIDRNTNIRRIGFVASEIVKHGGAVVCAAISPYSAVRSECRIMFSHNAFMEVFVDTPIEVCEARDAKGLYSLARAGKLENFTGINDPYEAPESPEVKINTIHHSPAQSTDLIINYLIKAGLLAGE